MSPKAVGIIYALVMIAVIVTVDLLFLRGHVALRLVVNIAMVLAFGAFYVLVVRRR